MSDEIKDNILSQSQWLRIFAMALFAIICWVLGIVMTVLVIGQVLFSLITGRDNDNLRQLGATLSIYFYQILGFLTYNTDEKPFPFSAFPGGEGDSDVDDEEFGEDASYEYASTNSNQSDSSTAGDDVFADISFTPSKEKSISPEGETTNAPSTSSPADTEQLQEEEQDSEVATGAYDISDDDIPTLSDSDDSADRDSNEEKKPEGQ